MTSDDVLMLMHSGISMKVLSKSALSPHGGELLEVILDGKGHVEVLTNKKQKSGFVFVPTDWHREGSIPIESCKIPFNKLG